MRTHRLAAADFDALASGAGDAAAIAALRGAQLSRRLLLLRAIRDEVAARHGGREPLECFQDGLALLAAAARRSRPAADSVLAYPMVGMWGTHCLRRLRGQAGTVPLEQAGTVPLEEAGTVPLEEDLGCLGGIAVAAALRAAHAVDITVRTRAGQLFLPTFGHLRMPGGAERVRVRAAAGSHRIIITGDGLRAEVDIGDADTGGVVVSRPEAGGAGSGGAGANEAVAGAPGSGGVDADAAGGGCWFPLRRLRSTAEGRRLEVALDDADPYRRFGALQVRDGLEDHEVARWQMLLDEAWALLVRHHPQRADAVRAGLTVFVPLLDARAGHAVSATSVDAFGAVCLITPTSAAALATDLLHEFQHTKLYALMDILPLLEDRQDRREKIYYAGWRPDPRPVTGLFQGAYAFLGLLEFWNVQRRSGGARTRRIAEFEFVRCREAVAAAVDTLRSSRVLTALGRRFVEGMAHALRRWEELPVDDAVAARARDMAVDHRAMWRLSHLSPDDGQLRRWADAWSAGRPCPREPPAVEVVAGSQERAETRRGVLVRRWLDDPEAFQAVDAVLESAGTAGVAGLDMIADIALVSGYYARAAELYKAHLARWPGGATSWAGLAVARGYAVTPAVAALTSHPETVRALYVFLRATPGTTTDPDVLAAWMSTAAWIVTATSPGPGADFPPASGFGRRPARPGPGRG
ncbi:MULTISPECIES: aKG-HExxH-type peptide beta-hydroxylase [unclassified Frankia]|uniref:aKG-HExxH-type peptide beta-hydroxylase n=1 Tax=unclassified Frankia TaxID=2632575 RepID=UPI0020246FAA